MARHNDGKPCSQLHCHGTMSWSASCGAMVCWLCGEHEGLARCYCGWSADGGNGHQQLVDMGETVDPEE